MKHTCYTLCYAIFTLSFFACETDTLQHEYSNEIKTVLNPDIQSKEKLVVYRMDENDFLMKELSDVGVKKMRISAEFAASVGLIDQTDTLALKPYIKYNKKAANGVKIIEFLEAKFDSSAFILINK